MSTTISTVAPSDFQLRFAAACGWISLPFWIIVYTPQILLNYQQKDARGLSLAFLIIWLVGDLTSSLGALLQNLLVTTSLIGLFYTAADLVLIYQYYYYGYMRLTYPGIYEDVDQTEHDPLLIEEHKGYTLKQLILYHILGLFALMFIAWEVAGQQLKHPHSVEEWNPWSQVLGYTSATLYIASRIPQIKHNIETKVEGISPYMFACATLGNVTFLLSIFLSGYSREHLLINMAWIIGAAGTLGLDFLMFGQYLYYSGDRKREHELAHLRYPDSEEEII